MISFKQLREKCWAGYHAVGMKKKNGKMVPNCVPKEEAPANAVGDGSGVALPPAVAPGLNVKKKKKPDIGLLKREE